jgi:hypothetical protein
MNCMQWIRDNFLLLFLAAFVVSVGQLIWLVVRRIRRGSIFPRRDTVAVLFEERWTSGRSFKSWITRYGGANNCLRVTVTEDEIWVTPHVPFNLFADKLDLEHRIPIRDVIRVAPKKRSVELEFRYPDGSTRTLELHLRRSADFLSSINPAAAAG